MRVLVRADGSRGIGAGHVVRMIALAERILGAGGRVRLASSELDAALEAWAGARGLEVVRNRAPRGSEADARWVVDQAKQEPYDWIVADGHRFGEAFQEIVGAAGLRLLLVDDAGQCDRYCADLVLNQNLSAREELYRGRSRRTKLLLGPRYALLRSEFLDLAPRARAVRQRATRILVTMGGTDPVNASAKVVEALARSPEPELRARVLVGPGSRFEEELKRLSSDPRVALLAPSEKVVGLMQWADLAIAGAGSATYELCFMGLPTLLVVLAENQREVARAMDRAGVCENLGSHHELDAGECWRRIEALCASPDRRRTMSGRGRELVDGRGADRVLEALRREL